MFYYFFTISFIIFIHYILIYKSNAIPLGEDDKMLIAFMKVHQETLMNEYSKQKYDAHFGIMYFMRMNWHCDQIADEFKEFERTECKKYRKYLDILYEYLFREYVGIPTVKPKFVFKKEFEINGPIIYAVNCLAKISQFYFKPFWSKCSKYKLNNLFTFTFELKLLNEFKLNYEPKLPINEMILELAIETANEYPNNESLEGIIRQQLNKKFDENLEEMFKKAEERAKRVNLWNSNEINYDKHEIIMNSKFDDKLTWTEDVFFSEFVKGLATNFEKYFKMAKEFSNYLSRRKGKGNFYRYDENGQMISFGLYDIEKMKEHLTQKYEAYLGLMYLMKENWHCDKIGKEFEAKCQTNNNYLLILYEYLFRLFVEGKSAELAK